MPQQQQLNFHAKVTHEKFTVKVQKWCITELPGWSTALLIFTSSACVARRQVAFVARRRVAFVAQAPVLVDGNVGNGYVEIAPLLYCRR